MPFPTAAQHIFRCKTDHRPPSHWERYGHPRRYGAPEKIADVGRAGVCDKLRTSCGVGRAEHGGRLHIASRSPRGLVKMMEIIVGASAVTITTKTESLCIPSPCVPLPTIRVQAAGLSCEQMHSLTYMGGAIAESPDISDEIALRTLACWLRMRRYLRDLYDQTKLVLLKDPDGKDRGNRGPPVWMQGVDPIPETQRQIPHRTPLSLARRRHHRDST